MEYEVKAQVMLDYTVRVEGKNLLDAVKGAEDGVRHLENELKLYGTVDGRFETLTVVGSSMISATIVGEATPTSSPEPVPATVDSPKKERKPRTRKQVEQPPLSEILTTDDRHVWAPENGTLTCGRCGGTWPFEGEPAVNGCPGRALHAVLPTLSDLERLPQPPPAIEVPAGMVAISDVREDAQPAFQPNGAPLPPPPPMPPLAPQPVKTRADLPYCPSCGDKMLEMGGTTDLWCNRDQKRVLAGEANYAPAP